MTCPACLTRHPSFKVHLAVHLKIERCDRHDADGRNHAPVDRYLCTCLFLLQGVYIRSGAGFRPSTLVVGMNRETSLAKLIHVMIISCSTQVSQVPFPCVPPSLL